MIVVKNLSYSYRQGGEDIEALKGINLTISPGDFVVILGRNGSGKSTLIKHLNGLLLPDSGEVLIDGLSTKNPQELWKIRRKVGIVFENPENQIIATLVEEDLAFGPENLGLPREEIKRRIKEVTEFLEIEGFLRHEPHLLSGGEKQKVAVASALTLKPAYLLSDESTSMLDPNERKEILNLYTRLNKEWGMTLIHVTHFPEEAILANRVIVMDKGTIVLDGSPAEAFSQVEFLNECGVSLPKIVLLSYQLTKSGFLSKFPLLSIDEMVEVLCSLS